MEEYTVTITENPLGISFVLLSNNSQKYNTVALHEVAYDSIGDHLGLSIGDELIAINGQHIRNLIISEISTAFNETILPFTATFSRFKQTQIQFGLLDSIDCDVHLTSDDEESELDTESLCSYDSSKSLSAVLIPSDDSLLQSIASTQEATPISVVSTIDQQKQHKNDDYICNDMKEICNDVCFDVYSINKLNERVCLLSNKPFNSGYHEWSVEILKCDVFQQEIGCVSVSDIDDIIIDKNGINGTAAFGARAIYGNELATNSAFYASYNDDNKQRCYRDLSDKIGWCTGDIIKVCLDLDNFRIKFLLNGKNVRKAMSLQRNKVYYPFISFTGNCKFAIINS